MLGIKCLYAIVLFIYLMEGVITTSLWLCPVLTRRPYAECSCDMPHTLRCVGDHSALQLIGQHLRTYKSNNGGSVVTLLELTLRGVTSLTRASMAELTSVPLQGLVLSSGEIKRVQQKAFELLSNLMALGLPNNQLPSVPTEALQNIPTLERLDLSNNKIKIIEEQSFQGLQNLTYIDLSENQITNVAIDAFKQLPNLSILRLRNNRIQIDQLVSLTSAKCITELDLSSNKLNGALGPKSLPEMKCLIVLQLMDNSFKSIRRAAFIGFKNLTHLGLHNNQIDVIEDHAFRNLTKLTHLDLSNNEIVAVSGSSLAHLDLLTYLDLSHNYLRSLSAEPLKSLKSLTELYIHDNDISMIDNEALLLHKNLKRFTVEDNPLNCDCLMVGFSKWLRDAQHLAPNDRIAPVCATPPNLEGASLSRLSKSKLCEDVDYQQSERMISYQDSPLNDDKAKPSRILTDIVDAFKNDTNDFDDNYIVADDYDVKNDDVDDVPTTSATAILTKVWLTPTSTHFQYRIENPTIGADYQCDGITIEPVGSSTSSVTEELPCRGDRNDVSIRGHRLRQDVTYRVCIALEETPLPPARPALLLSCSLTNGPDPLTLSHQQQEHKPLYQEPAKKLLPIRVSEVRSNLTSEGLLTISISIYGLDLNSRIMPTSEIAYKSSIHNCYVILTIFSHGSLVAQRDSPCKTYLNINMDGFLSTPYEICAKLSSQAEKICITPQYFDVDLMKTSIHGLNLGLIGLCSVLTLLVLVFIWFYRRLFRKPVDNHRCAGGQNLGEDSLRASYVILTATSKL